MKKVILVSGKLQSGKNQFTEYLQTHLESKGLHVATDLFARGVKDGSKEDFKEIYEYINTVVNESIKDLRYLPEAPKQLDNIISNLEQLLTTTDNFYEDKTDLTRKMLQIYGTNIFRQRVDNDYWVSNTCNRIQAHFENSKDVVILTDVRFPNEIDFVKDYFTPLLDRPCQADVVSIRINREVERTNNINEHESEKALDDYENFTTRVNNNADLESLKNKAVIIADKYIKE